MGTRGKEPRGRPAAITLAVLLGGCAWLAAGVLQGSPTTAATANHVVLTASPATLPADGVATSTLTATVTSPAGTAVAKDTVELTPGTGAACGRLAPESGTTNGKGQVSATYTAPTSAGSCTVVATESLGHGSGQVVITETAVPSRVAVAADPGTLRANGVSTSAITATVTKTSGAAVAQDPVHFSLSTNGSCGHLSTLSGTTDAQGQVRTTYTASVVAGSCTVTAVEQGEGHAGTVTIAQTLVLDVVTVTAAPPSLPANGVATARVTATVTKPSGAAVAGDAVRFAIQGDACGRLSASGGTTDAQGQVAVTYVASLTARACTVSATETEEGRQGTATIAQTLVLDVVTVRVAPPSLPANGVATARVTATVAKPSGAAVAGDAVRFALQGDACGRLSASGGTTDAQGQVAVTYVASVTARACTVSATETEEGRQGTATVAQVAVPTLVVVAASPPTLPANGAATAALTVTVTRQDGARVVGDLVRFSVERRAGCGRLDRGAAETGGDGQARVTYTAGTVPGPCTVVATEQATGRSGTATITQRSTPPAPVPGGYWVATADGRVLQFGDARFIGSPVSHRVRVRDVVGLAAQPSGGGLWVATADGHVYNFGQAPFRGSPFAARQRVHDVVGIAAAPDGEGYWVATASGHVLAYGSAAFRGSPFAHHLRIDDVVGIAADPEGGGYWVATADGHLFAYGTAGFDGSPYSRRAVLDDVVAVASDPNGQGYWVVTRTGSVFAFGGAAAVGSPATGGIALGDLVAMASSAAGQGYWLATAGGAVYAYGDAGALGSPTGSGLRAANVVAIARA